MDWRKKALITRWKQIKQSAVKNYVVSQKPKSVKLSYKEQRELEQLPQLLEELEEKEYNTHEEQEALQKQ